MAVVEKPSFKEMLTDAIRFDPEVSTMRIPTIQVDKEYVCKAAIDRLKGTSRE